MLQVGPQGFTNVAAWPVTVGDKDFPMALDPAHFTLFLACPAPARLAAYDTRTGNLLTQVPCVGDAGDMFYDAKLKRLYVIGGEGFVDVFPLPENGNEPMRLAHAPTASRARTGSFIQDLQMVAIAAPHTTNGPASIFLFQTKP